MNIQTGRVVTAHLLALTGRATIADALAEVEAWKASHTELTAIRAEREQLAAARDSAERDDLIRKIALAGGSTVGLARLSVDELRDELSVRRHIQKTGHR